MSQLDKILKSIGLVRLSKHEQTIRTHRTYADKLAILAKTHGVTVLFDDERLVGASVKGDVVIHGDRVSVVECRIESQLVTGPNAVRCFIGGNIFQNSQELKP